jgi:hypothetical protein
MMTGDRVEAGRYVICGPDEQCMDQNINRWYCHRDSAGRCDLKVCQQREAAAGAQPPPEGEQR